MFFRNSQFPYRYLSTHDFFNSFMVDDVTQRDD
jgi:hypothetical protein